MVRAERVRYLVGILAGMLIYIMVAFIDLHGWETIIASLVAGGISALFSHSAKRSAFAGASASLLGVSLILLYYAIINYYGVSLLLTTGIILYIPIITSVLFGVIGSLLIHRVREIRT